MGIKSDYLDLAVSMVVVFFLLSLVVSGINEGIQWVTRVRAKFLWSYLHDLTDPVRGPKLLPYGKRGIIGLWGWKRDARPVTGPVDASPPDPSPAGTGTDDSDEILRRLARSLDPIDPQQMLSAPGAAEAKRTSIKHIPPASLAQAFLEVFAETGRARFDDALTALVDAVVAGGDPAPAIQRVAVELGGADPADTLLAAAALEELARGVAAAPSADTAAVLGRGLVVRLGGLKGAVGGTNITEAAAAMASATWVAAQPGAAPDALATARAAVPGLSSAITHTFPERFPRQRIEAVIGRLGNAPFASTARRLWEGAEGKLDGFRTGLEGYFDSEMTRLSGLYKRSIRTIVAILGVLIAVSMNVNTLGLARDLWRNPEGRASLVAEADALSAGAAGAGADPATLEQLRQACEDAAPGEDSQITSVEEAAAAYDGVRTCVNDALSRRNGLDLVDRSLWINPAAWFDDTVPFVGGTEPAGQWWLHTIGIALTVLVLVVGAPFWFDLLKRLTGIRKGLVGQT